MSVNSKHSQQSMEHRLSSRVEVNAQVRIFQRNVPVGTGAILNASPEGIFIAWHGRRFRRGTRLTVEVLTNSPSTVKPISGLVMHETPGGIGLLLHIPDVNVAEWLREITTGA